MRPGYQEQILYILNKHHSIVTVELGDAVTDDILQLIDSAKREARGCIDCQKLRCEDCERLWQT